MSTQSKEPVPVVRVDDIHPIPAEYQVRERYTLEEIQRLEDDIKRVRRLWSPIRVCYVSQVYLGRTDYEGKHFMLVGGTARIAALQHMGLNRLRLGKEVVIDDTIHNEREYFNECWHDNDMRKAPGKIARIKATMNYTRFGLTQEQIAKELGIKDRSVVSDLQNIGKTLPLEVLDDPVMEKIGVTHLKALTDVWIAKGEKEGRILFENYKVKVGSGNRPSELASEKRIAEVRHDVVDKGLSVVAALGSYDYDHSPPKLEERIDRLIDELCDTRAKAGVAPPPIKNLAEAQQMKDELEALKSGTPGDPSLILPLEMIMSNWQTFIQREEEWKAHQRDGTLVEQVKAQATGTVNALGGLVERLKEKQGKEGSSKSDIVRGIRDIPGIRRRFSEKEVKEMTSS